MPFVPALNTALAEIRMFCDGQKIENTLYFSRTTALTTTLLASLGTDLVAWWIANYAPLVTTAVALTEILCTDLTSATSAQVSTPVTATFGSDGGDMNPSNCALCVSFRTDNRGRSFRGRNFITGSPRGQLIGPNEFDNGYLSSVVAAYTEIGAAIDDSWTWSVVSRRHNKANRPTAVISPITAILCVDNVVDSMRRRLPGRGA